MVPAYDMLVLSQKRSHASGRILGCSLILSVNTRRLGTQCEYAEGMIMINQHLIGPQSPDHAVVFLAKAVK